MLDEQEGFLIMRKEGLVFLLAMLPGALFPGMEIERTKYKIDIVADVKSYQVFRGEHFFGTSKYVAFYEGAIWQLFPDDQGDYYLECSH